TDGLNYLDVGFLAAASNVIGFAASTTGKDHSDGRAMILNVEPVANVLSVSVHGQGLACGRVQYRQRDQLFRELVWAIVVRAVGRDDRQSIRVKVGPNQMIGSGLRG